MDAAPLSVDHANLGPSGESKRRWIVPPDSAHAATRRPTDVTAAVVREFEAGCEQNRSIRIHKGTLVLKRQRPPGLNPAAVFHFDFAPPSHAQ
jgi:hypothetical protein